LGCNYFLPLFNEGLSALLTVIQLELFDHGRVWVISFGTFLSNKKTIQLDPNTIRETTQGADGGNKT